jgi:hypothetical protein
LRFSFASFTYMKGDGTADSERVKVRPGSRSTVRANDRLGEGDDP